MIPISAFPKRFPSALGKPSKGIGTKVYKSILTRNKRNQLLCKSLLSNNITILKSFSTKSQHASNSQDNSSNSDNAMRLREGGRSVSIDISCTKDNINENIKNELNLFGPRTAEWWTGKAPVYDICPGVETDGKIYSLPQLTFPNGKCSRKALQDYFDNTWTLTEVLLAGLQGEEAFMRAPYHNLRHPLIFYYGHPAALYINKLRVAGLLESPINPYYEVIFETGVDEMSWDDLSKNEMSWPSVAEVQAYRREVYTKVTELIQDGLTDEQLSTVSIDSPVWALVMAFEHERIHLETSSFLMTEMPTEYIRFPDGFPSYHESVQKKIRNRQQINGDTKPEPYQLPQAGKDYPVNSMIAVPEQTISIGKPRSFPSFGWDNEYGKRDYVVPQFEASKYLVSNGEFLEFVKDGGYARRELWTDNGWQWRAFRNVKWPTLWVRKGPQGHHEYDLRLIFDIVPMVWDHPVCVNYHEATAFAQWKTLHSQNNGDVYRVMTELEHRAIRDESDADEVINDHAAVSGGSTMMLENGYNTNLACSSTSPVNALKPNGRGFHDVFGNSWHWTPDFFSALDNFTVHPYYEDFSTPCFDGQHNVIMGGSFISTGNESSIHSRFHFRPHFFQHAGFRLVKVQQDEQFQPDQVHVSDLPCETSDTDAPTPYVGSYPFRRSSKAVQEMLNTFQNGDATATTSTITADMNLNELLQMHFGKSVTTQQYALQNTIHNQKYELKGKFEELGNNNMLPVAHAIVSAASKAATPLKDARIVEVGCGPGGLTFALAAMSDCSLIIGIDHNMESIKTSNYLLNQQQSEQVDCSIVIPGEGEVVHDQSLPLTTSDSTNPMVEFRTSDPMCLPAEFQSFDCVIINDVIDRVSSPNAVLGRLGGVRGLVKQGGLLVIRSGFQWREQTTPKSLWLGGYNDSGIEVSSQIVLEQRLNDQGFELVQPSAQVPVCWPTSAGELRINLQHVMVFKRIE